MASAFFVRGETDLSLGTERGGSLNSRFGLGHAVNERLPGLLAGPYSTKLIGTEQLYRFW
jgi:hypothetical protein